MAGLSLDIPLTATGRYVPEWKTILPWARCGFSETDRSRLRPASFVDGQIAAIAATNDLVLVTANRRHFAGFRGLTVVGWRSARS